MRVRTAIAAVALAALAGCAGCDTVPANAVTSCNARIVPGTVATDLLFVVDDSGSMFQEQDELRSNLATFIDQLIASPVALDLRMGVTTTDVEDYGAETAYGSGFPGPAGTPFPQGTLVAIEQDASGVGLPGHLMWGTAYDPAHLTSTWGGPRVLSSASASSAELARDFKANVTLGTWGSGREQPLSAMRRAVDKAALGGPNFGFLRAGARLAVVILTDEDDCSGPHDATHVGDDGACHGLPLDTPYLDSLSDYVTYLDSTVGGGAPELAPIVGVIAGFDASGAVSVCRGTTFGTSTAAYALPNRLNELLRLLDVAHPTPSRTYKDSICRKFGPALTQIAARIIPQTMPLRESPADWRMLAVAVRRESGAVDGCRIAESGGAGEAEADVVFTPPQAGSPASLRFKNACVLGVGDQVQLGIVCAR